MPEDTQNEKNIDKNTLLIILYFVQRLNGVLGKTHLQKLLFLTDLLSTKKFKKQITVMDYKKCHYGPFSSGLGSYTDELEKKGLIEAKEFPFLSDPFRKYTRYYLKKQITIKPVLVKRIGEAKTMLIDEVINSYGNMSLQEVLDIIYQLQIVRDTKPNKPLDIAKEVIEDEPDIEDIF